MTEHRMKMLRFGILIVFIFGLVTCDDETHPSFVSDDYFIDNRIDSTPTYVSSVERFLQLIVVPFQRFDRSNNGQDNIERLIQGLPKPLQNTFLSKQRSPKQGFGNVMNRFKENIHAIYPGTLWCGFGDIARDDEELGLFRITDTCCKEHDSCSLSIAAGHQYERLLNNGIFARSLCVCDDEFRQCLKRARSPISAKIGITYFNILRPQCFKEDYPIESCRKYASTRPSDDKCLEYELDNTRNKTWQWFDNPDF